MTQNELLAYFFENYLPKEEITYRLPLATSIAAFWPEELNYRKQSAQKLPLASWDGHPYWYALTEKLTAAGDQFVAVARDEAIASLPQYAHDEGVMDEAYFSSVIEGAYSTRQRAHELLASNEPPQNRNEQMIYNNYHALRFVLEHLDGPINEAVILEIAQYLYCKHT